MDIGRAPAAFGRLCVETCDLSQEEEWALPAAFGRLCVETDIIKEIEKEAFPSRLRAAVC